LPSKPAATPAARHGPARTRSGDPLRDGYFDLLLRSYRLAQKSGRGLEVYRGCARQVHALCGERWARATIFPRESKVVRRFLAEAGLRPADTDAVEQLSLMANPWASTWTGVLESLAPAEFDSVCSAQGEELLRAAVAQGRGVVLAHYHTLFAPLFWPWLDRRGIARGVLIREWVKTRPATEADDAKTRALEGARELKAAADALRKSGMVHVMGDGYEGSRKTELEFCNRRRGFETTFIDLALMAGAPILTVASRFSADGSLRFEIGAALRDDATLARAARTDALLRQYTEHVRRHWQEHPADISWFQMWRHLELPAAPKRA
jgi:lauroyl/myristoyl acyltransferase